MECLSKPHAACTDLAPDLEIPESRSWDSQAQSASSILVTRSTIKAQVTDRGLSCCLDQFQDLAPLRTRGVFTARCGASRRAAFSADVPHPEIDFM